MAWLFSCFRCKQRRQCRSSSPKANSKITVENAVLRNANVLEAQDVVQVHSFTSLEKNLGSSKPGNDVDKCLLSLLRTETSCYSPRKQSFNQPLLQKEELQQVKEEFKRVKDLKAEANDLQDMLDPPNNFRRAFDDLHVDSEEGQAEEGRRMARLHSLLTKIESEGETLVLDNLMLEELTKLDCNNGVAMGEQLLSSTKNESQLYDIEASKELHKLQSSFSPATHKESRLSLEEETEIISPDKTLSERTFQNWRGCSSETKVKQPDRRRDGSFESAPLNIEEHRVISRLKRSSKALSFSEFSLVEAAAGSKFTSKKLELEDSKRTESPITRKTMDINRMTALKGETDGEISRNLFANVSGSLPTWSEQAISLSLSQDVALYDTDMEVDSKAVKSYSNENSHGRPHGHVQTLKNDNAHEVPLCADLTMEQSQAFTFEDSYNGNSEAFSQLFTECNSKRKVLDEEVEELDFDQMSSCSDASSFLTSPLPQVLSERDELIVRKRAHRHATATASAMLQENTAESSAQCGKSKFDRELSFAETAGGWIKRANHESLNLDAQMSFEETNSKEINLPKEGRQLAANTADLVSGYQLLPSSKLWDDVTSRQAVTPSRRLINISPESCTYSSIDHMKGITCNEFASLEAASFSVPSPETVTYMKHWQSPSPLGAKESSTKQRIMPQETPSVSKSVLEISNTNFLKQQPTPRTPSASSSQVETPNSIQSAVSPADLAKDRPIMGTVAAHWSHSSSKEKWWDGKGIPNSTNKYKEDQKVSWHATPFEVRLERALAKQGRVLQKKLFGGAMPTEMELRTEPITSSG